MTEKRFKVTNVSINGMVGLFKLGNDSISVYDVVRLVNELLEENKQLKEENEQLKSKNNMLKVTIGRNEAYIKRLTETSEWHC